MEHDRNDGRLGPLPAAINKVNPAPDADALSITALVKKSGRVAGYQLSDGRRISREEGVELAKNSRIKGVSVAVNQGTEYLRALPDGEENNNLSSLPSVTI